MAISSRFNFAESASILFSSIESVEQENDSKANSAKVGKNFDNFISRLLRFGTVKITAILQNTVKEMLNSIKNMYFNEYKLHIIDEIYCF